MITKEKFSESIALIEKFNEIINKCKDIGIKLYTSSITEIPYKIFDIYLEIFFTEAALDLIYWYLYEDVAKVIYEEDMFGKTEILVDTPEKLWDFMNKSQEVYFND